jgi:hypothetical protein
MARNEWRGDPFASVDILTEKDRENALPYVERGGLNAGTVLPPLPGAATRNAMQLLVPKAVRPEGTVVFAPPGGGLIAVPRENVRGGGAWAPTEKGYIGQGMAPLGPAPTVAVEPGDRDGQANRLAALGQWAVENGGPNRAWDGVRGRAEAPAAERTTPVVMREPPVAPVAPVVAPKTAAAVPSVIEQREAQAREVDMQRARIERGMAPGGIRSGPTSVWDRRVAAQIQRENAERGQRMQPQAVAGAAGTAYWDGTKWVHKGKAEVASGAGGTVAIDAEGRVTSRGNQEVASGAGGTVTIDAEGKVTRRGNQEVASGAGGTVAIDAEGKVTRTPAPEKPSKLVDTETGLSLADVTKEWTKAKFGNKEDPFYKIRLDAARERGDKKQIAEIEAEFGPKQAQVVYWESVLRRMGKDPNKDMGQQQPTAAKPEAAQTAQAPVAPAGNAEKWRRR